MGLNLSQYRDVHIRKDLSGRIAPRNIDPVTLVGSWSKEKLHDIAWCNYSVANINKTQTSIFFVWFLCCLISYCYMFYMFSTSLWGRLRYLCIFFGDQVWSKELIFQRLTLPVHCKEASERGNVVWCDWWDLVRFWKSDVLGIHLFFEVSEVYHSFASFIYSLMSSVMISDNFSTNSTLPKPDHHTSGQEVANARLVTLSQRNATISSEREHVKRVSQHIRLQNSLVHVSYRTSFETPRELLLHLIFKIIGDMMMVSPCFASEKIA